MLEVIISNGPSCIGSRCLGMCSCLAGMALPEELVILQPLAS